MIRTTPAILSCAAALLCAATAVHGQQPRQTKGKTDPHPSPEASSAHDAEGNAEWNAEMAVEARQVGDFFLEPGKHGFDRIVLRLARALEANILIHHQIQGLCDDIDEITLDRPLRLNTEDALTWFSCFVYRYDLLITWVGPKRTTLELVQRGDQTNHAVETRAEVVTMEQVLTAPTRHMVVTTYLMLREPTTAETLQRYERMFTTGHTHLALQAVSTGRAVMLQGLQCDVAKVIRLLQLAEALDPVAEPRVEASQQTEADRPGIGDSRSGDDNESPVAAEPAATTTDRRPR